MSFGFEARKIVRQVRSGSLATLDRVTHAPYVSLSAIASDYEANPIFLLSDLADHTQNIMKNANVSLLCEKASNLSNPQAGPRVTLVGTIEKITDEGVCLLFLQNHPSAKMYAQFSDFNFYRLRVEKAHYVGGFGKAEWIEAPDYIGDSAAILNFSTKQEELIFALNEDFPLFAYTCATKLLKQRGKNWKVLRIDADGIDLKLASRQVRYPFEKQVKNFGEVLDIVKEFCR